MLCLTVLFFWKYTLYNKQLYNLFSNMILFLFQLVFNGFGLCVRAGFDAQDCQPALNLNRSTKLRVST
ncbi:hypothetical protein LV84_01421 [Algoriphagus ratkowskyi]|uniref:Uncharacterized protein n=1 Tax=Algoriphagus ratkowskyi TaxID=57028 RepID=A0A2W7RSB0_9BACT|nr:hypothetical protein LV84_01421 [Algoriphagus ratkowskyi]